MKTANINKIINIFSFKLDFKDLRHTFWSHTNRSTIQQKLFQFILLQEAGASGNNIEKEPQRPMPKIEKDKYTGNIFSTCNAIQVVVFCKHLLSLKNNNSNFFTLKVT